jgi:hypothetical protein
VAEGHSGFRKKTQEIHENIVIPRPEARLFVNKPEERQRQTMDRPLKTTPFTVNQHLKLELVDSHGAAMPIEADLSYDPRDPFAVTTVFGTAAGPVRWTFGRELLLQGLYEPTGDGDVHVWPCLDTEGHAVVIIELCSPDGEALVQVKTGELTAFNDKMLKAVPVGEESEYIDLDATITAILDAEAA